MIKRYKDLIKIVCYILVIPLIIWNMAIGKSIDIWSEYSDNMAQLSNIKIDSTQTKIVNKKSPKGSLLDFVAKNKQVEIVKYNRYTTVTVDDYSLIANELIIKGDFFKLLRITNKIEKLWDISSLSFHSEMNYKNKRRTLKATIITQDIIKTK